MDIYLKCNSAIILEVFLNINFRWALDRQPQK